MTDPTHIDQDYKQAFNDGYLLSQELGLDPNILDKASVQTPRLQAMQDGMIQHQKDIKDKGLDKTSRQSVIPPLDLDKLDKRSGGAPSVKPTKDKTHQKDQSKDKGVEPEL